MKLGPEEAEEIAEDYRPLLLIPDDLTDELHPKTPEFQVYYRRWWILGLFSITAFTQALVWITFSTFSSSAKEVFGWTDSTIALLVDWGNLPYVFFVVPLCWLLDVKGLRFATLFSSFLLFTATTFRCISSKSEIATPLIHVAHILNGIAGILLCGAPAHLSAVWFPANQRTTATSIAVLTNYMGIAFGYLIGPYMVPHTEMSGCNNTSNTSYDIEDPCNTSTSDNIEQERDDIMRLMYYDRAQKY